MLVDGIQESEQVSEFNTDVSAEWKNTMWRNIYCKGHHPFIYHCELKRCLEGYFHFYMLSSFLSVQFRSSCSVVSDSLRPHVLQHTRLPCPSPTTRVYSNSCSLSQWCHPTISSSVVSFFSCPQSFVAWGFFQMSQLSTSGGQSIGVLVLGTL